MPKRVLVPLAPGFEETEAIAVVDLLRRAEIEVVVAGTIPGPVEGSHGIRVVADASLEEVEGSGESFDLVVLPGGQPGTRNLAADPRVIRILRATAAAGRPVAAICAAPSILAQAGLLAGKKATSHPSVRDLLDPARYSLSDVVVDGGVVTSRGAGTAVAFGLKLVEVLEGVDRAHEIAERIVAPEG